MALADGHARRFWPQGWPVGPRGLPSPPGFSFPTSAFYRQLFTGLVGRLPMCARRLIPAMCWEKEKGLCDDNLACE